MKIHIVQKGDTLWEIAKKYHVDFEELKELNSHLASPDMIMPGMKIRIPTHSKKITQGEKAKTLPKTEMKHVPAPKKEVQMEKKPATELPKMPTFPFEPEKMLPTLEEKHKEYPIETLPELPKESNKKKEKPKAKEQVKPKQQPQQEKQVMPKTQPMHQPMHQPIMPPMEQPCFAQPQMMPMFTYPCQGYMPMPHLPSGCGCGFSGGQGFQPFHYSQQEPMYIPMQPQVFPGMMHHQQFQAPPENMYQAVDDTMMPMYPEPADGFRNEEQELFPSPDEAANEPFDDKEK